MYLLFSLCYFPLQVTSHLPCIIYVLYAPPPLLGKGGKLSPTYWASLGHTLPHIPLAQTLSTHGKKTLSMVEGGCINCDNTLRAQHRIQNTSNNPCYRMGSCNNLSTLGPPTEYHSIHASLPDWHKGWEHLCLERREKLFILWR